MNKVSTLSKFLNERRSHTLVSTPAPYDEYWINRNKQAFLEAIPKEDRISSRGKNWGYVRPHHYSIILPLINDFLGLSKSLQEIIDTKRDFYWKIEKKPMGHKGKPSWFMWILHNYYNCDVEITPRCVMVYLKDNQTRMMCMDDPSNQMKDLKEEYKQIMLDIMKMLKKDFNIRVDFRAWGTVRKVKSVIDKLTKKEKTVKLEWGFMTKEIHTGGDETIDAIPKDFRWIGERTKKMYMNGIEVKDEMDCANIWDNLAIRRIAPDITDSINGLGSLFTRFSTDLNKYNENIEMHLKTMEGINNGISRMNELLKKLEEKI